MEALKTGINKKSEIMMSGFVICCPFLFLTITVGVPRAHFEI
jgi:hypothetical protein